MEQNGFVKGALIGGILGGVAALLLAPKAGKQLREEICNGYDCVNDYSKDFVDNLKEHSHNLLDKLNGVEHHESNHSMLAGGALGSIIGVVAALLLAPKSGDKLRASLGEKYDEIHHKAEKAIKGFDKTRHNFVDKVDDWKDILSTVVEKVSAGSKKTKSSSFGGSHDLVELATLGLRLYDQFSKRR